MEGTHNNHFAWADYIGHGGVNLRIDVFKIDDFDGLPGFSQVDKCLIQYHLHDTQFGRGKFPTFNFCVPAITAEEIIYQLEYQFGIQNNQSRTSQGAELDHIEAGGYIQRMDILSEFLNLNATDRNICRATQQI